MKSAYDVIELAKQQLDNEKLQDLATELEKILQEAISDKGEFSAATRAAWQDGFNSVKE